MNNEDNKGFSRFQFSTEFDRGDNKKEVEITDTSDKSTSEKTPTKRKNYKRSNYKKNNRNNSRRSSKRKNNKKIEESVELVKDSMEEKNEDIKIEELIPMDEDKNTEKVSFEGDVGKAFEVPEEAPAEDNSFEVPDFQLEPEEMPVVEEEHQEVELPSEEVTAPESDIKEDVPEEEPLITEVPAEEEKVEEVIDNTQNEVAPVEVQEDEASNETPVEETPPEEVVKNPYDDELSSIREKGVNITEEARDIDLEHTLYRDQYFVQNGEAEIK